MSDDVGRTIRVERERRGWSQEFLAAKVGATQSTIDRIESGLTRKSRVLPDILSILDLNLPGFEKKQLYTAPVGEFVKVSYVLPRELIERIEQYKKAIEISSDDEVVRRIIDDFLKKRDDILDVVNRIISRYKLLKSMREAAGMILSSHPLVSAIAFEQHSVKFVFNDPYYKALHVNISSFGTVRIIKEDKKKFLIHAPDAPKWLSTDQVTQDAGQADYLTF